MDIPTPTIMLRGLTSSTTERDVRRTLDSERANYTDVRLVRDKKTGRWIGFVDFVSANDAKQFMRDCQGEIEVRKTTIRLNYSNLKEKRDEEYDDASSTIMLRGIPTSLDHRDIRDALDDARVSYLDVRVIKDKVTGISKGFGFVDFASVHEARRWMDYQKGVFRVRRYEVRLMYSTPRNQLDSLIHHSSDAPGLLGPSSFMIRPPTLSEVSTGDWICSRCSSHNFRRRDQCYKCQLPRSQVQSLTNSVDGVDLIGTTPCNTLVLRCLDALTTEDDICQVFQDTADVKVRQCHVMRDEITHASRCFAFAELPTVADAYKVMDIVNKEFKLFEVGGKAVTVSYAKNTFNTIMATLKTEGSYNAQLNSSRNLALDLAHAAMAAQNNNISPDTVAMNAVAASALLSQTSNNGAAVAQAAIQQKQTEQHVLSALTKSLRNHSEHTVSSNYAPSMAALAASGQQLPPPSFPFNAATASTTTYPFPDTSKYIYDESTRFYYDPVTGLMYEPNSKYFYDRGSQQYYYWDQTKSTYLPVPQSNPKSSSVDNTASDSQTDTSDALKSKDDRGKTAQQIAREMEKWAKKMNAQKKASSNVGQRSDVSTSEASRTADTGYAILEASAGSVLTCDSRTPESTSLVAEYGGVEDSDDSGQDEVHSEKHDSSLSLNTEAEAKVAEEESKLLDWTKLACMLCSRGFKDATTLQKHRAFSGLHYENLNKLRGKYGLPPIPAPTPTQNQETPVVNSPKNSLSIASLLQIGAQTASNHAKSVASRQTTSRSTTSNQYRDRAKERREKYGIPSPPRMKTVENQPSTVQIDQEVFIPPLTHIPPPSQSAPNVGSRLMEKMGWQAGQGLGRSNQGRTQIVEAEFREAGVGLGIKTSKRGPQSDNYKDNVKRAMFARFHELE
ncbi:RNA-binding protein isoform 2 [Schistosoma japonicum]|uniref:RNA-binding protein isoform 2 n=3 Tax=Schistosoma japonicum TaxID=6182 RepID=A0A4Z2DM91_SCHJA|nr:RNA-binding protein 10 [Schistosoma japonicum]TNN17656.1 RNA-binding protein isoform 2 [Schistosoma japonicum]